jgi:Leucine-rich repeat (LRR) protein
LTKLDLFNNHLTSLPESIGSLTQLESRYLDRNPLEPELEAVYEQGEIETLRQFLLAKANNSSVK